MDSTGIRYGSAIASAAAAERLDPALLAAVAAQETGGPGSNSGNNILGDGGHGHGLFQIDDRTWPFARTAAALDPVKNAAMAAHILGDDLTRCGGNVHRALSAYNAGSPNATGTRTTWGDGQTLGYADSVMRHYAALTREQQGQVVADNRETAGTVNALGALGSGRPVAAPPAIAPLTPMQPATSPAVAPSIPAGFQAQAATNAGAQADRDEANLVDQGNVFAAADDDA